MKRVYFAKSHSKNIVTSSQYFLKPRFLNFIFFLSQKHTHLSTHQIFSCHACAHLVNVSVKPVISNQKTKGYTSAHACTTCWIDKTEKSSC